MNRPTPLGAPSIGVLLFALLIAIGAFAQTARAAETETVGRVTILRGTATLERGGQKSPLVAGATLRQGDKIVTGPLGRLKITFADGSIVALGAATALDISRYAGPRSTGARILSLLVGIVRATLPAGGAQRGFEIRTRTAIASVRSTDWIVEQKGTKAAVFVVQGWVRVSAAQRTILLSDGEGSDIEQGKAPGEAKAWGVARAADAIERTWAD